MRALNFKISYGFLNNICYKQTFFLKEMIEMKAKFILYKENG